MKADAKILGAIAKSVRSLSMDAVQAANSGHPGLPLGVAELGAVLYANVLRHDPSDPQWIDRDRFVLSAGHGSMLLYSLLHLSGYDLPLEELRNFRQLGSATPGHPEYGHTAGVETTTGPLGAGISNAVGMAVAETMLAHRFNTPEMTIIDHYTYVLAGDGCMMEGVASEAASLAGHLKLGKLILFYDSNRITIEGDTSLAFTEDVAARYRGYGWQTLECSAYDTEGIQKLVDQAKAESDRPTLITLTSTIGFGSPNKQGSHEVHGAPLGEEEVLETRRNLGIPEGESFYVDPAARDFFSARVKDLGEESARWREGFRSWRKANPEKAAEWDIFFTGDTEKLIGSAVLPAYQAGQAAATRASGGKALNVLAEKLPNLVGGSADLAPSNKSHMNGAGDYGPRQRGGRNLHFGVREHAMGGVVNGIALHGGFRVYAATFLVFADYMRPAIRLAALMGLPVTYIFTHDSVFVGEDGPTHQPVEHAASLRIIPNVKVLRPADGEEVNEAWKHALSASWGPTALLLTRQSLTSFEKSDASWRENFSRGAYIARDCDATPEYVIAASGSELGIALEAAQTAAEKGLAVRVISVHDLNAFVSQPGEYFRTLIPPGTAVVSAEAGVGIGWERLAGEGRYLGHAGVETFGASGPAEAVAKHFGLSAGTILNLILEDRRSG
jgi:transketolase